MPLWQGKNAFMRLLPWQLGKFPHQMFKPKQIVSKEQVEQFYYSLETPKEKALFMLYATTGLRKDEILRFSLKI